MLSRIYAILNESFGESKQGFYSQETEQYQFNCPCCADENGGIPDGKHNLEILLSPTKGLKYHCWRCGDTDGMKGSLTNLMKKYAPKSFYLDFKTELETIKQTKLFDINLYSGFTATIEDVLIRLPKTYQNINISQCNDKRVVNYLKKRHITQDIVDQYNLGYTNWDEPEVGWRNRIIIPSYDIYGDLNYYVGRDFTGKSNMKYKNCDGNKSDIIFHESLINWDATIYLCEGALDCIYLPNSIAMLGKGLSRDDAIYKSLMEKANDYVVIALDKDTKIEETKKIYSLLNTKKLLGRVKYIAMQNNKYKDFGEIYENQGRKGMLECISTANTYSDIDLLI